MLCVRVLLTRSVWEGYAFEVLKRALLIEQTQAFHERFPEQGVAATEVLARAGKGKLSEEAAEEEAVEIGSLTGAYEGGCKQEGSGGVK